MMRGHGHPHRGMDETYEVSAACSWSAQALRALRNPGSTHVPPRPVEHCLARQHARSAMVVACADHACLPERATSAVGPESGHSSMSVLMVLLAALACDPPSAYALGHLCRETQRTGTRSMTQCGFRVALKPLASCYGRFRRRCLCDVMRPLTASVTLPLALS